MMYPCPSCRSRSITYLRKWLSWSSLPATCSKCGQPCAIAIADSSGFLVGTIFLATLSGFVAVWLQALWPWVSGLAMAVAYYFWRQHTAGLAVVSAHEQQVAKRSAWVALLVSLFPAWFT